MSVVSDINYELKYIMKPTDKLILILQCQIFKDIK